MDHQLLTNEWNWLDSPAEDVVLVAHLHVQLYVLLFGCSTVSLTGQIVRRLPLHIRFLIVHWVDKLVRSHILHTSPPFHVTRHLAAWTNSEFGNVETWCDDCGHCPDDWKRLTEQTHSHLEVPLENCGGSRNQAQEETEEVMSQVAMWVKTEVLSSSS